MLNYKCGICYEIPTLCHIETTYKCNQNCLFCYNPKRGEVIDYSKLDKIIESVAKEKIPHVYLSGGEPSLIDINQINKYVDILSENSSVTILSNGVVTMKGLSNKIACVGIPIHGTNAEEHEKMTQLPGSFEKAINSIKYYKENGFDVRCIIVLTGYNYNKIYDMIKIASELGMESIYVNRYEDGGIGATNSLMSKLKPTLQQFREALTQILKARENFVNLNAKIGFGTAIPFCIDKRLITENIGSACGVGTDFCAINSKGDFRICNQSEIIFGNVLNESIKEIWKKKEMNCYRDIAWITEPCRSCKALKDCMGGCKVDVNCCDTFCIDYAVRNDVDDELKKNINFINSNYELRDKKQSSEIDQMLIEDEFLISPNKYLKINEVTRDILMVTRYQSVVIDETVKDLLMIIKDSKKISVKDLYEKALVAEKEEFLHVLKVLLHTGAIDISRGEAYGERN